MIGFKSIGPVLIGILAHGAATLGAALPPKDSGAIFGSNHGLGFSDGVLYLHTGDSIYTVDFTDPLDPAFALHMTGLRSAFGGGVRTFEGGFATASGSAAMISMGYWDRGLLSVDLARKTTQPVADFDDEVIFSTAGRADGTFYAMWSGTATSTQLYHVDPATRATLAAVDLAAGTDDASGGMAFDSASNLMAGSFDFGQGVANVFRIEAADLAAFESGGAPPPVTFIGSGAANGNVNVAVDRDGLIFFNTTTGIGLLDPATATVRNFYRDLLDPNLFSYDGFKLPLNGLAYDETDHRLVFAEHDPAADRYDLVFLSIPEPASAAGVLFGVVAAIAARRPPGRGRA